MKAGYKNDGKGRPAMTTLHHNSNRFIGTNNPRYLRVIAALLISPLWRESVDSTAGVSNGPDAISRIRALFLDGHGKEHLDCTRIDLIDLDGKHCSPGVYSLSERGRQMIVEWLARCNKSGCVLA